VIDISDAPPGFADIKFKTTAIQEQLTNRSSGRSIDLSKTDVPGSQVVFLFPAKSPVCKGESSFNSPLYLFSNPNAPAVPSESDVGSGGCEVPIAQLSSAISPKTAIPAGGSASLAVPDPNAANISLRYKEAEAPAALAEIAAPKLVAHSVFVNSGWRHAQPGVTLSQMGRKIDFVGLSTSAPLSLNLFGQ